MMLLEADDVEIIMSLARELTGTKVNSTHHGVVVQNVVARFMEIGCANLEDYLHFVNQHDEEMSYLISAVTIHTTGWFRENGAFEKLNSIAIDACKMAKVDVNFRVLSAACSTGEEVYTVAAILEDVRRSHPNFNYEIEGWDIDPISLRTARLGRYDPKALDNAGFHQRSLLENIGSVSDGHFSISSEIKDRCCFKALNILDQPKNLGKYDFVLCRNVLIYFEVTDIAKIVSQLYQKVSLHGHICVGVSETSAITSTSFQGIGHAVYANRSQVLDSDLSSKNRTKILAGRAVAGPATILIVDDEQEIRNLMTDSLRSEGHLVLAAGNAAEALEVIQKAAVDLILSDYRMPGKNGLELCKIAKSKGYKNAFVIVSGLSDREMVKNAAAIGCDEVILKPFLGDELNRAVAVYLGRRKVSRVRAGKPSLLLFGASTGGTEVLVRLLAQLPAQCPPVMVVQHIASGFARDFAERLARVSGLSLGSMQPDEQLRNGHLYMSLGDYHIGVRESGGALKLSLSESPQISGHRPSVDYLFQTAAECQRNIFAALLTGMGRDGSQGLLQLKQMGAETIAQSEETCSVFGMPKEAIKLNAALFVLSPEEIRKELEQRLVAA